MYLFITSEPPWDTQFFSVCSLMPNHLLNSKVEQNICLELLWHVTYSRGLNVFTWEYATGEAVTALLVYGLADAGGRQCSQEDQPHRPWVLTACV